MTGATTLPKYFGILVIDLAVHFLAGRLFKHGDMECEVIGEYKLEGLSDNGGLLLHVKAVGRLLKISVMNGVPSK